MKKTLSAILFTALVLFSVCSCAEKGLNDPRKEKIEVHLLEDCSDEPLEAFCLSVLGGTADFYIRSDVDGFNAFWQDAAPLPWAKVTLFEKTGTNDVWHLQLEYSERSDACLYYRRGGMLSLVAPSQELGTFLPVYQGPAVRVQDHFDSFAYGSSNPHVDDGEVHIEKWSTALKDKGFDSEPIGDAVKSACYAGNGYIKLGDAEGNKGSLLTPYNELYRYDSLLVVTFRASAYQTSDGTKDENGFSVEVVGGGVIRDLQQKEQTSIMLTAPYINPDAEDVSHMWGADSYFMVFVAETEKSQLTTSTRIKISSGESGEGTSRLFIDDICVMRLVDGLDEDLYSMNQGSGPDRILAARNN